MIQEMTDGAERIPILIVCNSSRIYSNHRSSCCLASELVEVKKRLDNQNSAGDQMIRELQSREADLTEALDAKDSQLAVLRVRLEEADKDLNAKKQTIIEIEAEKNR